MTHLQNTSGSVATSIVCEDVGRGRSSLPYVPPAFAQMLAKSTLPPELVVVAVQPERRQRKPSLARLVAKAKQLGVDVTVEPNGVVTFRTGSTTTAADEKSQTEVDEWIAKHAH